MLALTTGLPERSLAAGEVVYREGDAVTTVLVLVDGQLEIERGGLVVNSHRVRDRSSATRCAPAPTSLGDGDRRSAVGRPRDRRSRRVLRRPPSGRSRGGRQLAGRLYRLTAYVADVREQFADRGDHLGVFAQLLTRISDRPPVDIEPGSDRSPDY